MLVLDANILIRAVLGSRVLRLIETYASDVEMFVPAAAVTDAREHLTFIYRSAACQPNRP